MKIYEKHKDMFGLNKTEKYDNMTTHIKNWNHRYDLESVGSTIFSSLNMAIGTKMLNIYH